MAADSRRPLLFDLRNALLAVFDGIILGPGWHAQSDKIRKWLQNDGKNGELLTGATVKTGVQQHRKDIHGYPPFLDRCDRLMCQQNSQQPAEDRHVLHTSHENDSLFD